MASVIYDVIVVGGGTAGLVLAHRLSEDPTLEVVVLEGGEDRGSDPNALTPGSWPLLSESPADRTFHVTPQKDIARQITVPLGRTLGGPSAINSFLFTPTSKATVEGWEKLGNEGWDCAAYEAAMKKSFTVHKPAGAAEGNGPIQLQSHLFTGLTTEAREDVHTIDAFFRHEPEAVAAAVQDYGTKGPGPRSTSNMVTMTHLPLPEFDTEQGKGARN